MVAVLTASSRDDRLRAQNSWRSLRCTPYPGNRILHAKAVILFGCDNIRYRRDSSICPKGNGASWSPPSVHTERGCHYGSRKPGGDVCRCVWLSHLYLLAGPRSKGDRNVACASKESVDPGFQFYPAFMGGRTDRDLDSRWAIEKSRSWTPMAENVNERVPRFGSWRVAGNCVGCFHLVPSPSWTGPPVGHWCFACGD